jgi:hypothetical protein
MNFSYFLDTIVKGIYTISDAVNEDFNTSKNNFMREFLTEAKIQSITKNLELWFNKKTLDIKELPLNEDSKMSRERHQVTSHF